MPPHPVRQIQRVDEGDHARRRVHRFYRDAAPRKDKKTSIEMFGGYIHTYKFCEAVED